MPCILIDIHGPQLFGSNMEFCGGNGLVCDDRELLAVAIEPDMAKHLMMKYLEFHQN
jgi:hypothetical protein